MSDGISSREQWPPTGVTLLSPTSSGFAGATVRWNAYGSPTFSQAVTPTTAEEVAEIVKSANAAGISFLATGGRHGYGTAISKLKNGLAIDLSRLKSVSIDEAQRTVTVGGGATIRDVINPVAEAEFQIGSGACNAAGFTGTALGAGIGYLQGTFGLVIDALVSVDFVTAKGEQIKVSERSNPDLFWAIRGAGANFGIVTSSTYKLSQQVNGGQVFHAELMYSKDHQLDYFKTMEAYQDRMPPELGFSTTLFWDPSTQSTGILSSFIYVGTEEAARSDLKPFFDLSPVVITTETIPFQHVPNKIINGIAEAACQTSEGLHSIQTVNVRNWSAATFSSVFEQFDAYLKQHEQARTANSAIILETFSTAAATSVPDHSTAYPWRDSTGYFMLQMRWPGLDNPFGEMANEFARGLREEIAAASGYPGVSAYVNYAWGDETLEQIYREDKLHRLTALKRHWDPDNVFGYWNGIPTE